MLQEPVITVIVLLILATTVIISISNTNIIEQASETVFKSDMADYKEAYNLYVIGKIADNPKYDKSTLSVDSSNATEFTAIFGEVPEKYSDNLMVVNGTLMFVTNDTTQIQVLNEFRDINIVDAPCFDTTTRIIYSVNLPEEVTELTIPSEINGVY